MRKKYYSFEWPQGIDLASFLESWLTEVKKRGIGNGNIMAVRLTKDKKFQLDIEYE